MENRPQSEYDTKPLTHMLKNIYSEPNPILHKAGSSVDPAEIGNQKFKKMIRDLSDTMREREGVGIAAPQIGESVQLCVIAKQYNIFNEKKDLTLFNPKWEKTSNIKIWDEEGCLSVPEIYGKVRRYNKIKVSALDENGKPINFTATDFFARIIQHEVDHLQGILFIEKAKDLHEIEKGL